MSQLYKVGIAVGLLVVAAAPSVLSAYYVSFLINLLMYISVAASWNLFSGFTGYPSLGQGLFFGIGAYAFAVVTTTLMLHPIVGFLTALVVATVLAACLGLLLLRARIRMAYFAIVMLGFNEIFQTLVANSKPLGSSYGLTLPPMSSALLAYYFLLAVALGTVATTALITRSPIGFGLKSIVADEVAAEITGINTPVLKIGMFIASAAPLGLSGAMIAWYWSYIDPYMAFDLNLSFEMLVMAVFGGVGTVTGPVLGAIFICVVKEALSNSIPHVHPIVFGVLVLGLIIWRPGGLIEVFDRYSIKVAGTKKVTA